MSEDASEASGESVESPTNAAVSDTDEFDAYTDWLIDQLDAYGPRLSPERRARVAAILDRTVALEAAFFDAASE